MNETAEIRHFHRITKPLHYHCANPANLGLFTRPGIGLANTALTSAAPPTKVRPAKSGEDQAMATHTNNGDKRLRSRRWFDEPSDPAMTALYLERSMNFGITPEELRGGKPIIGIAAHDTGV